MKSRKQSKQNEIDPTFGKNGRVEIKGPGALYTQLDQLTQNTVGAIFVSGSYFIDPPDQDSYYTAAVGKLTANGSLDPQFGTRGFVIFPEEESTSLFTSLALQSNENFFVSGSRILYTDPPKRHVTLAHYNPAGHFINIFTIEPAAQYNNSLPQLLIIKSTNEQLSDKVLMTLTTDKGAIILRRNANGLADQDFGNNGEILYLPTDKLHDPIATHIMQGLGSSSEQVYVAGTYNQQPYFARLDMTGKLDPEYAEEGIHFYTFFIDTFETFCQKILPLSNGGLLVLIRVAGIANYVIKLTATGMLDTSFHNGKPMRVPGAITVDMTLQADGKFLIPYVEFASDEITATLENKIVRYTPDGEPDAGFGNKGIVDFKYKTDFNVISHAIVQPDGKIIVSGMAKHGDAELTALIRLMA